MKKIIYYITDHGLGHTTRSIAIIRELQKANVEVTIRNNTLFDFIKKSLTNIEIEKGITDVGPSIKQDGISIDEEKSITKLTKWINGITSTSKKESNYISKKNPDLIISDISAMPIVAAQKLDKHVITISNFSWYDVLKFLPQDSLKLLKTFYDYSSFHIKLPLSTEMSHFKNIKEVGFVTRRPTMNRETIREKLRISNKDFVVLFALGGSDTVLTPHGDDNCTFLSMNSKIRHDNLLDVSNWTEGQDLVSASDLVICKCGYGMISECLTNGIPFYYISSDTHLEQFAISKSLESQGLRNRLTFQAINEIKFSRDYMKSLFKINKKSNDTINTVNYILEFLRK